MERVTIDDIDNVVDSATVKRSLTDPLGCANVAVNYYELSPGDSFAYGYHRHEVQEELFLVLSGSVTFETEAGDVVVHDGDAIRFEPGEFQQGTNRGSTLVRAFAIGAPREDEPGRHAVVLRHCESCGERTTVSFEWSDDGETRLTHCADCGSITGRFTRSAVDRSE